MKSFKEQLKIIQENGCSVIDICIAGTCEAVFDFHYTDEDFERLCGVALNAYLASDSVSEDDIAYAINGLVCNGKNIDQVCEMSKWDLLNYAVNGVPDFPWCENWQSPDDCKSCGMIECNCNPMHVEGK